LNALYVEEDRLITSAGTGAGLDCGSMARCGR
jgi:transcriptional regulator GlxA family with amidase domain